MITQYTRKSDVNVYIEAAKQLKLDFEILSKRNPTVIIRHNNKELLFRNTSPSFNSLAGHQIASDKYMTSMLLRRQGIPFPESKIFEKEDVQGILEYARDNYPVVLKRNKGAQGNDVHVNIADINHLFAAMHSLLKSTAKEVIVEDYIEGDDYRIIVFRGEVIDIIERVPAYIIGDGESTIESLITDKNEMRIKMLGGYPIKVDKKLLYKLAQQQLDLNSIIDDGLYLKLNSSCNYSSGGETKQVKLINAHPDNLELFKKIQSHSFLDYVGIDFISQDISKSWKQNGAVINEINSSIGIDTHYYADMAMDLSAPQMILKMYFQL